MSARSYRLLKIAAEIAVPIALLLAWQLWTVQAENPKFPRLSTILHTFREMWLFSQFDTHVVPSLTRIAADRYTVELGPADDPMSIASALLAAGGRLVSITQLHETLEDVFVLLTGEVVE